MKLAIGQKAHDVRVSSLCGKTVRLSSLWETKPVLLFFHCHLGSIFARQAFKRLDCGSGQMEANGVRLVSIAPTTAAKACAFCKEWDSWHTCLADPSRECYRAYGIPVAAPHQLFGPKPISAAVKAIQRGYRQSGMMLGSVPTLPSAITVGTDGIISAIRYGAHIGDIPSPPELRSLANRPPPATSYNDCSYADLTTR